MPYNDKWANDKGNDSMVHNIGPLLFDEAHNACTQFRSVRPVHRLDVVHKERYAKTDKRIDERISRIATIRRRGRRRVGVSY